MMDYFVYMLRCADGSYYSGYTTDVERRERVHNEGKGAKYTRSRLPVYVVYREVCADKGAALRRERALKRLTHREKEGLARAYQRANGGEVPSGGGVTSDGEAGAAGSAGTFAGHAEGRKGDVGTP